MYFCYSKYKFLEDTGTSVELKFTFDLDSYTQSKDTWLGLGKWHSAAILCFYAEVTLLV